MMQQVFDVNVFGLVRSTRAFLPLLRKSPGARVINIGSVAGIIVRSGMGPYSASKFAVEALSDGMRHELGHWNISVSLVQPAYVNTLIAGKQMGENAPERQLSERDYALYKHLFEGHEDRKMKNARLADSPDVTTDAIFHALESAYPQTRYAVANAGGIPAWLIVKLRAVIPDRLLDWALMKLQ